MVVESAKSLATCWTTSVLCVPTLVPASYTNLGDSADVLHAILGREAEILVQAEAHVVAIESVGLQAEREQVLLKRRCDGGLARGRETGEPDSASLLLTEVGALLACQACVPCDVAVGLLEEFALLAGLKWDGFDTPLHLRRHFEKLDLELVYRVVFF